MPEHLFKVGDLVRLAWLAAERNARSGQDGSEQVFRVVRLLASDSGELLYRLQSEDTKQQERIAAQQELSAVNMGQSPAST